MWRRTLIGDRLRHKVKGPVLIPFSLLLVLAVGSLFLIAYLYEEKARQQDLADSLGAVQRLFRLQIDNDAARLHAALCPISSDVFLAKAFLSGDKDALLARTGPLFQRLNQYHRVTHFYILDAQRRVVLRVHQPDLHGDIVDRTTTLQAERTARKTQGIELGPLGTLTLRSVMPWQIDGQLVGYLELGEELGHIGEEIHRALDVELMVTMRNDGRNLPLSPHDSQAHDHIVLSSTLHKVPPFISAWLAGEGAAPSGQAADHAGKSLYTALFPIVDAAGNTIGDIVVIRDVTSLLTGIRESLWIAALLSLLVGSLVIGLIYVILDRVEKDYRHQREMETRFSRLSIEHQRIVQIEKMSEVGRTISEIAHQINNPLVGVLNMAQLAEREADDPVRVRELLADIRQAGTDCHAFLERMLAFSKVSRSEHRPTDMVELITETIALFEQSRDTRQAMDTELPQPPMMLDVDPVLIRHALFNLLSNASRVSPPECAVWVRLVKEPGPDQRWGWSLEVSDQGPGLSVEVQEKLFTPFFTTQPNGTGLGLAVVQHVAMLHEGRASGRNRPAGGAIFALWLPEQTHGATGDDETKNSAHR
ncbi:MAG: ATP-binding protein [Magnetococcus sp. WYHC-3]